jgi:hypothetical protein
MMFSNWWCGDVVGDDESNDCWTGNRKNIEKLEFFIFLNGIFEIQILLLKKLIFEKIFDSTRKFLRGSATR